MVIEEVLEDGFFHADVHPGNFVVMPAEVTGAMDFGKQEWSDLIASLPRTGNRMLERAERGELLQIGLKDTGPLMKQIDRLTIRLALSLLLAAPTISLALLRPADGGVLQLPVTAGYVVVIALTAWLFISILRGTR